MVKKESAHLSSESAIEYAYAKRNDTSERDTWRTGQRNCLQLLTRTDPTKTVYRLVDWHGDKLDGTFYEPELQKVVVTKGKTYRVESVLRWRNKRREVLVKWSGYPTSFNSWIDAKTLVNY